LHDAIIIGAGHNGLTCAYYLAKRGLKVAVLEAAGNVGGAAVTDEFLPGFRNSAASYTVSLLQPKVIRDMQLERHGLKVVLRKTDNFLPGDGDYLLAGRGGLTRKEIARHHRPDAEAYDRYLAELETVVRLLKKWLLRAPPNVGRKISAIPKLLSLGRDLAGLSLAETRIVHDFAVRSAADILDRHFAGDLVKALFGFDGVVGNFASPQSPGTAYVLLHHLFGEAAGVPGAWGHAIGGMGSITQAMARACREAGVDIILNTPVEEMIVNRKRAAGVVAGGKAWQAETVVAGVNPKLLFDRLVPHGAVDGDVAARMHGWKCESATFRMNVALSELPKFTVLPKKGNHLTAGIIMAPSLDYMHRAWLDAAVNGWSKQPIIEMLIPSTLDPTLAPKGRHVASLSTSATTWDRDATGTWNGNRRRTRSSPRSMAMRPASPSRCSGGKSTRRSISSAASAWSAATFFTAR
jgi:phytoene dehydrogenase-like protein